MDDTVSLKLGYHPLWLEQLAETIEAEGSVLNGKVRGPANVAKLLAFARSLYEFQLFSFAETSAMATGWKPTRPKVDGTDITNTAIIHRNCNGETDHIAMTHRPLNALHVFSALLFERFGDEFGPNLFHAGGLPTGSSSADSRDRL